MFDFGFGLIGAIGDARAVSEKEWQAREAQMARAYANAKPNWIGMENYRPPSPPIPPLPQGWADWYEIGDDA